MGDPLSATGSAVGIISLGLAVTQSLVQYYNSYQAYVTDTATTLVSIKDLNALFASIECSVRSIKLAPDKKNRVEECLLSCSFGVKSLQDELTKITRVGPTKTPQSLEQAPTILNKRQRITSRLQTISKRIAYPFRETTLKRLQEIVSRLQANLSLAVATLQIDISEETSTSVDEIKIGVNSLLKSDRGQRILNWLNAPDPSSNYNAACEKKQAHTGKWFLEGEEFKDWKEAANSFAWIHGNPGCGKTVLSSTIIHELLDESSRYRSSAVGYFYFDYNDERKQDVHKCVRSLISHISLRCSDSSNGIPRALDALYSQYDDGHSQPTSDAVLTTLRDLIQDSKHTFIVLDALDECTDIDRLMRLVKEIHEWDIPHLHLLATSRRLEKIERGLRCLTPIQRPIQQNLVNPDIQEYIRYQLHSDSDFEKWPIMIRDEIESALMEKADGMFQWAVCQLKSLKDCVTVPSLRNALLELPEDLDETYERILMKIPERSRLRICKILQWLAFSAHPMNIDEISEVFAIVPKEKPYFDITERPLDSRAILRLIPSLAAVVPARKYESETLRLAHFSVKEYLLSPRIHISTAAMFSMCQSSANSTIAYDCLAYLAHFDQKILLEATIKSFPLSRYAASYWADHMRDADADEANNELNRFAMDVFASKTASGLFKSLRYPNNLTVKCYFGKDIFIQAVSRGLLGLIKLLLQTDSSGVISQALSDNTALIAAIFSRRLQLVEFLLNHGAQVNAQRGEDGNAVRLAAIIGHPQIVELLLRHSAEINEQGGQYGNALHAAANQKSIEVVELLLSHGADVNAQGGRYGNALQAATQSREGILPVMELVLSHGADVNAQGGEYGHALQAAASYGHFEGVRLLLHHGADVNAQGGNFGNALQAAACEGHLKVLGLLLHHGADVNAQGGFHGNALQAATLSRSLPVMEQVLSHGADVNAQGGEYGHALQAAASYGLLEAVELLLYHGADINAQGGKHGNAVQAAIARNYVDIRDMLLSHGAVPTRDEGSAPALRGCE